MKKILLIPLVLLLLICSVNAQGKFTETVYVGGIATAVQQQSFTIPQGYTYSGQTTTYGRSTSKNIGMLSENIDIKVKNSNGHDTTISVVQKTIYRTIYEFDISQLKYTQTNHASVTNVKVNYGTDEDEYTFKITQPNSLPTSDQEIWSTVGSSGTKQTGITYSGTYINPASGLNAPITGCLSSGKIYLGIVSESESTSGSSAQMSFGFSMEITYQRDNEARTVTAQNYFHGYIGGKIYWDGSLVESPKSPTLYENETHNLGVYTPQTNINDGNGTYDYIWHQGGINTSKWTRQVSSTGMTHDLGPVTSLSYTTNWQEVGAITHTAYMRRNCNLTFTGLGGTITIDGSSPMSFPQTRVVVEMNPVSAIATNFSADGMSYTFNNKWTTSSGQVVSTPITSSKHETYLANYDVSIIGSSATLQTDLLVPKGSSLTIPSGSTVTLNGHSIINTGGTIIVYGSINGINAYLYNESGIIKGYFGRINSAVSYSTSGQSVIVPAGNFLLNGNCTIPTGPPVGGTLTFQSGANVDFNGYYIDRPLGATFNIQNGATVYLKNGTKFYGLFTSIQPAINNSSSFQDIILSAPSYSGSLTFTGKMGITLRGQGMTNTSLQGSISVTNSNQVTITDLSVSGGLLCNNSTWTEFHNSIVSNSTVASVYGGYTYITGIKAANIGASFGVSLYGGSGTVASSNIYEGDCAVFLTDNASYDIGGQNRFCNNGYDIYAQNGAYAYAYSNTYSRPLPSSIDGNVDYYGGVNSVCDMPKEAAAPGKNAATSKTDPALTQLDGKYLELLRKVYKDKNENKYVPKNYATDFDQLLKGYENLLNEGDKKETIKAALAKIQQLYYVKEDKQGFSNFISGIYVNNKLKAFVPYVKRYEIWDYISKGQYDKSLKLAENILQMPGITEDLIAELLYEKGIIYKNLLNDSTKAKAAFNEIIEKYPGNSLVIFANHQLGNKGVSFKGIILHGEIKEDESLIFDCSNYPNPGNPTTTINYTLPHSSDVEIKIHNIMGQEIKSFIFNAQNPGKHNVVWDSKNSLGESVSSGVYIYTVRAKSVEHTGAVAQKSRKMLLLK